VFCGLVEKMAKLVLFDLDQTLIDLFPLYERAFHETFVKVYGFEGHLSDVDFAGNTVSAILLGVCAKRGVPKRAAMRKMPQALRVLQSFFLKDLANVKRVRALAGVRRLLSFLKSKNAVLGVATGAPRKAAVVVLERAGLAGFFSVLATGEAGGSKESCIRRAKLDAQRKLGRKFPWYDVVVVGDSPREAHAARALGARGVAVATGFHSIAELEKAKPAFVFGDFSDWKKAGKAILP
jgi:phosphoglycolate phosphatase-like HAD superfamily hydrolase